MTNAETDLVRVSRREDISSGFGGAKGYSDSSRMSSRICWGMGLHFGVPSLKTEMWRGGRIGRTKLRILRRESYADGVTMITIDFSVISNHQYSTGQQISVLFSLSMEFSQKSVTISSPYLSEIWSSYSV